MTKLRLTANHREHLKTLARELVKCPVEQAAVEHTYAKALLPVRKMLVKERPQDHMQILQKYEHAETRQSFKLQGTSGGVVQFTFNEPDAILFPIYSSPVFLINEATTKAVFDWLRAKDGFEEATKKKRGDYYALISSARTLEEVVEVWSEAETTRAKFTTYPVVTLNPEVISRIQRDVQTRKAA